MDMPKAARVIGTVEKKRMVYIEDYVLQYLTVCEEEDKSTEKILYGKKEKNGESEIYMIYGVYEQEGQAFAEQPFGRKYGRLGHLDRETGAIVLDDWEPGRKLKGYYVFYDAEEKMKDYLGNYYEKRIWGKRQDAVPQNKGMEACNSDAAFCGEAKGAELVALSAADKTGHAALKREHSPFLWIRMAVICIFIIFCTIAVMTVNSFEKLNDFIQAAVMAGEIMEQ